MGGVGGAACALPYPDRGVNQQGDKCRVSKGLGFGQGLPLLRCLGGAPQVNCPIVPPLSHTCRGQMHPPLQYPARLPTTGALWTARRRQQ